MSVYHAGLSVTGPRLRRALGLMVLPLGVAASVPGPLAAQCPDGSPPPCVTRARAAVTPPAPAERGRRFLVLPFRNVSRNPEHDWLVEGSTTMLAEALSRWEDLSVVSDERLYPALRRAGLTPGGVMDPVAVRRVAEETGGWTAVNGEVLALGSRIRLSARASDVVTNREVARVSEEVRSIEDVRGAYERISARLLASAGVDSAPDLAAVTTRSLQAYRAYLRGMAELHRVRPGPARAAFREAMRLDTGFAQAHAQYAVATIRDDLFELLVDTSDAIRAADRAAALAARLPAAERRRVRLVADFAHARFGEVRAGLDTLLSADSSDLAALDLAITLEPFDLQLVPAEHGFAPRLDRNRWVQRARRLLELDPGRHAAYDALVSAYLSAGGVAPAVFYGIDAWSDLASGIRSPSLSARSTVVLRDSFDYGVTDSVPAADLEASRRRGATAALQWARRWVGIAPEAGSAHFAMARALLASGDTVTALRELDAADRLGGGSTGLTGDRDALRLLVLTKRGNVAEAARVADSLWLAMRGSMRRVLRRPLGPDNVVNLLVALAVQSGRFDRAATIIDSVLTSARRDYGEQPYEAEYRVSLSLLLPAAAMPYSRQPAAETLLARLATAPVPELHGWIGRMLNGGALDAGAAAPRLRRRAMEAARTLIAAGDSAGAHDAAAFAAVDTSLRAEVVNWPWVADRLARWRAAVAERHRRFRPVSATVSEQEVVIEWAVDDTMPFTWDRAFTRPGSPEYTWAMSYTIRGWGTGWGVSHSRAIDAPERTGSLGDLIAASYTGRSVSLRTEPGRLLIVRTRPDMVATLRRERPPTARVYMTLCRLYPGDPPPPGGCADAVLPITYR